MKEELNFKGITSKNWKKIQGNKFAEGISERTVWEGGNGKKAIIFEFSPGSKFPGIDKHETGPEQIYVISGIFNDGRDDHREGTFINNPIGTSHIPQSSHGCVVMLYNS
ncbi:MAG: cupin domain-containing protein [Methylophaga sp.]|nr:cupin domain-containing protein [Methylophaga sp.]